MPEGRTFEVERRRRLDQLLAENWENLNRPILLELIRSGDVLVNGKKARKPGQRLRPGDEVTVLREPEIAPPNEKEALLLPPLPLEIAYEDDAVLVVEKPAGMAVRPSRQHPQGTLSQILGEQYPETAHVGSMNRAGVVQRLEPEASGLVLAGKSEASYRELRHLIKRERVEQVYTAMVIGNLTGSYTIDQPIGNVKRVRQRLAVAREGRPAQTFYRAQRHYKERGENYTLLEVRPKSSRLHQIRVHLSWYGFPIVGDDIYGPSYQPLLSDRLFLHLGVLSLPHPVTGEELRVESPLPPELLSVLQYMTRPKV